MKKSGAGQGQSASELISKRIAKLGDWRGETLSRMRKLIKEADPDVVEEGKWMGTPIWSHDGIICTGESYKNVVKLTFSKGASLKDPALLFNSSLDGNARRAIDIRKGEEVHEPAFSASIQRLDRVSERATNEIVAFLAEPPRIALEPDQVVIPTFPFGQMVVSAPAGWHIAGASQTNSALTTK